MSLRRQHPWMLKHVSASLLFWAGLVALPAYLLQDDIRIRLAQVVLFGSLARVAGKRLQWLYFLSIAATITLFHLIVPSGEVIAEFGAFHLTVGALRTGLFKALSIIGMVFLSLVAVRADLRLPGRVGSLVGKIFWAFEQIMERRDTLEVRRPLAGADGLLLSLYGDLATMDEEVSDTQGRKATASRSTAAGWGVVVVLAAAQWVALLP